MPCVLPHCSLDEFERERETLEVPPVVLKLPDTQCVPRGFFCALVCSLMQKWKLRQEDGKLTSIYKNFVQFTVEDNRVTVADTFFYVEDAALAVCCLLLYAAEVQGTGSVVFLKAAEDVRFEFSFIDRFSYSQAKDRTISRFIRTRCFLGLIHYFLGLSSFS